MICCDFTGFCNIFSPLRSRATVKHRAIKRLQRFCVSLDLKGNRTRDKRVEVSRLTRFRPAKQNI